MQAYVRHTGSVKQHRVETFKCHRLHPVSDEGDKFRPYLLAINPNVADTT
jgi:hypothetical protein